MSAVTPPTDAPRPTAPGWTDRGVLTRLVVLVATWVVLVGFVGAVAAYLGAWHPLVALTVLLVCLALAWRLTAGLPGQVVGGAPALALVVGVLAVTVWTGATHSEQVLPRRDSASYLQATISLATEGRRPVPVDAATIGGPQTLETEGLTLASPAFYEIGSAAEPTVQPQFMPGPALWYSLPWWAGGATATFWAPAVAGGLALLAIGLLVARSVGAWWGTPAVLLVGACFPWLHTSRSTYSEPLAGLTLAAGFLVLTLVAGRGEAARAERASSDDPDAPADPEAKGSPLTPSLGRAAAVAGLLVGGTSIVRIDALRETMLLIPVAALLAARGRTWAAPMLRAAVGATLAGFAVAGLMSWRYLGEIGGSLVPLVALVVLMSLACWWLLGRARAGWALPGPVADRLPVALGIAVLGVGALLALRPLVMTVRQDPRDPGAMYVARMQAEQGLPVDGGRTYAEHSVEWLAWWVGPAALVVALLVLAVLAHRLGLAWTKGAASPLPAWGPALLVATGSTLLTLWRPGITPDHPWADRRLLIALPLVLVLVVAAAAWGLRSRGRVVGGALAAVVLAATVVPTALATWPHRAERIEAGQLDAVRTYCDALGEGDVVVAVDDWAVNQWPQVTRGMCGVPALATTGRLRDDPAQVRAAVAALDERVRARGGQVLLVAARGPHSLADLGVTDRTTLVDVMVEEDMRILEQRPDGTTPLRVAVWAGRPATP